MNAVLSIGTRARAALRESGGLAHPLAAFPDAPYYEAAGEIVWVGSRLPGRHPRAVLTAAPVARGRIVSFDRLPRTAWSAALPRARPAARARRRFVEEIDGIGEPRGFGALLHGRTPEFPLDHAVGRVQALAAAYAADDEEQVLAASRALLGLGTGLTPSGDDLCGGALFGRRLVSRDARWRAAGEALVREAGNASHVISAALLADLVAGASFESLHALADALVAGDIAAATGAARTLAALGHTSGWDMLTGFVIGVGGMLPGKRT